MGEALQPCPDCGYVATHPSEQSYHVGSGWDCLKHSQATVAALEQGRLSDNVRILQLLNERDRWQYLATQRQALRVELEEALGFTRDATYEAEEFARAVQKVKTLIAERAALEGEHAELTDLNDRYDAALKELTPKYRALEATLARRTAALEKYGEHDRDCILSWYQAGEPTETGGYRVKYKDVWYESRPVNQVPKCECGLDAALDEAGERL